MYSEKDLYGIHATATVIVVTNFNVHSGNCLVEPIRQHLYGGNNYYNSEEWCTIFEVSAWSNGGKYWEFKTPVELPEDDSTYKIYSFCSDDECPMQTLGTYEPKHCIVDIKETVKRYSGHRPMYKYIVSIPYNVLFTY